MAVLLEKPTYNMDVLRVTDKTKPLIGIFLIAMKVQRLELNQIFTTTTK